MIHLNPLEVSNLSVGFKKPIFQDLNLVIGPNEFVTIMGENGCGKTLFLEALLSAIEPLAGKIQFWGQEISNDKMTINSRVGWVPSQQEKFPPHLKVSQLLKALSTIYPTWNQKLCEALIDRYNLNTNSKLVNLSMGEQSKVRLLKALSFEPDLLILDELTANLSESSKEVTTKTLIDMFSSGKMSVLYICHSSEEANRLSDKIYRLESHGLINAKEESE